MSLTIDLSPEEEAALEVAANARGLELPDFVRLRLLGGLPHPANSTLSTSEILAELRREGALGVYADDDRDSAEIARELRERAWKRAC